LTATSLKTFVKSHAWLLRIGLITAMVIIGFQVIGQLVIYRYLKLDYYLSLVAVAFLAAGLLLKRPERAANRQDHPAPEAPDTPEPTATPDLLTLLTSKEYLVLRLLAEGKTNKEIAVAHSVEVSTVKTHVNNIYAKLSVSNRAQARARYAEIAARMPIS
jgi:DNA-binding CsgD family transcriptional regulator